MQLELDSPMILCEGKYGRKEFGNSLPNGSISGKMSNAYIIKEQFYRLLCHFNNCKLPERGLITLDGHHRHLLLET